MKKRTKLLLTLSAAAGAMAAVNHYLMKVKQYPAKRKLPEENYNWTFGNIRYTVMGKGEPILLIHRPMESLFEWESVIMSLAKHYKVYALDLIGFGFSGKPKISYSSYLYASLIRDFVKNVIGRKTNAVASAESCGFLYSAHKMAPDYFNKIIFVSPEQWDFEKIVMPNKAKQVIMESPVLGTFIYNILVSRYLSAQRLYGYGIVPDADMLKKASACAHYGGEAAKYAAAAFSSGYLCTNGNPMNDIPVVLADGSLHLTNPNEFVGLCLQNLSK